MPYVPPTLNLPYRWWNPNVAQAAWEAFGAVGDPSGTGFCQLRPPSDRTVTIPYVTSPFACYEVVVQKGEAIMWPALPTPEYQYWCAVVEVPSFSFCYYFVAGMFDVGFGFSNEHRVLAVLPGWYFYNAQFAGGGHPHWPWINLEDWPNPAPAGS